MIRFLLATSGILLLGSMGAFFLFVSLLSIAAVVGIVLALAFMFALGVEIATVKVRHDERKMRPTMTKIELKKFCKKLRKHTLHKIKRK